MRRADIQCQKIQPFVPRNSLDSESAAPSRNTHTPTLLHRLGSFLFSRLFKRVCWVAGESAGLVFLASILLGGLTDLAGLSGGARLSTALTLGVGRLTTLVWGRHGG